MSITTLKLSTSPLLATTVNSAVSFAHLLVLTRSTSIGNTEICDFVIILVNIYVHIMGKFLCFRETWFFRVLLVLNDFPQMGQKLQ